jgi:hypothetical protein
MLAVLNVISTRAIIEVKNLVLSPQGDYCAQEVLCKIATTLPNEPLVEQGSLAGYGKMNYM